MLKVLVHLAAVDNAIFASIDLEQEKHVMFINLAAIISLNELVDGGLDAPQIITFCVSRYIGIVKTLLSLNFCIDPLFLDEVALK